ncbi:MAG: PPC domain-containing protein [Planctomycetota bacterium]
MRSNRFVSCSLAAIALMACVGVAIAADPRVSRLEPHGAQRGTEATIRIVGQRLGDRPEQLLFYEPGVELLELTAEGNDAAKAKLRIAPDCQPGPHALRLRTATGLSNLVTLHVGDYPEVAEQEPNNNDNEAQVVPLGTVINGFVAREETDCFGVELNAGQRLSVEVEGIRLGRVFFDPYLEIAGPSGALLAACDDTAATRQDPSLSIVAKEAGLYLVRLRESALRGGNDRTYRLHIGGFARPAAVFPPAVRAGEATNLTFIDESPEPITQEATHSVGRRGVHASRVAEVFAGGPDGVGPSGMPVRVVNAPIVAEAEPNNDRNAGEPIALPATMVGSIGQPGDLDHFPFTAKKNETFELRVLARRLRSPIDPVLRVYDESGKQVAANDDDQGHPDGYVRFRAPSDSRFVVRVEDYMKRGGPEYVYAVEATRPRPRVELTIHEFRRYIATTVNVPRGNRTAILVNASRKDVGGAVTLGFDGLPEGVSVEAPAIAGNYYRGPVVFSATDAAPNAGVLATPTAQREDGKPLAAELDHQSWLVRGQNNVPMWTYNAHRTPVAVTEPVPFRVKLAEPKAPLVQSGAKDLRVVAERLAGADGKTFDGAIRVRMLYHSPGVSSNRSRSIAAGKTEVDIPVTAAGNARLGDWDVVMTAEANVGGNVQVCTQLVKLRIAEPYFTLSLPKTSLERGASADFRVAIEPATEFAGPAKLELINLPHGVTAAPLEVEHGATEATFRLTATKDARLGRQRNVSVRAVLTDSGEPVTHTRGGGEIVVDPAADTKKPEATQTASSGGAK